MTSAANYTSTSVKEVSFRQFAGFKKFPPKTTRRAGKRKASSAARLARELARLRAEMRGVLELVPTGVLVVDSKGRIRFLNERLGELFELGERRIPKVETFEQLAETLRGHFRGAETFAFRWKERGTTVESDELEMVRPVTRVISRKSGPVMVAEKNAKGKKRGTAERNSNGERMIGWREVYEDITGQRHFQSKMVQTEKMAALGQLVSGIAHELNNPLTGIMGYAQLLLGRALDPKGLAETKNIYNEAERARRIVKNLLFFARESKPERVRSDLNEIVEKALALRSYELKVQNIAVDVKLQPNLPVTMADPYQLQQVVLNLLVNAEQALLQDRGSGRVSISTFTTPVGKIAVEIADDGPGIPEEIASRIFDPFFSTKPPGIGTGLGLSIVYGIVKQHGGEVIAENLRTGGARFVVELPVVRPAAEEKSAEARRAVARSDAKASRILVVEDEPTVARLITEVLSEEGHQVDAATDSQEGLTRLSRQAYDAVICDLRMPRLDGPAFYESLVRSGNPVRDHVLFVTGDTLGRATREFLEPRKLPFLEKPFLVEELKLAVDQILEKVPASQQMAANGHSDFQSFQKTSGERSPLPKLKKGGNGT